MTIPNPYDTIYLLIYWQLHILPESTRCDMLLIHTDESFLTDFINVNIIFLNQDISTPPHV